MEFSYDLAQKLLTANGVKLARPNTNIPSVPMPGISNVANLVPKKTTPSFTLLSPAHIENMASDPNFCISDPAKSSDSTSEQNTQSATPTPPQVLNEDLVILTDDGAPTVPLTEHKSTSHDSQSPNGFVYRPPGSSDGILLTTEDVACLAPGSFLNDTIINFYLKYLFFEQLSAFQRQATHLFNCFFYSRLSSTPAPSASVPNCPPDNSSPDQLSMARHSNVAKWTRRVDLFSKDYIIIPINENLHWFLGLVCYPWMAGMVSYTKLYEAFAFDLCQLNPEFVDVDHIHVGQVDIGQEELTVLPSDKKGEAFDRWRRRRLAWLRRRGINAMPCILLFDSIPSHSRVSNLHVIRNYLQAEWNVRRSERDGPLHFNKDTIRGFSPRVPSQSNLVDCGIFLLHYVEMFFRKPVKSYTKDYFQNEMSSWFCSETLGQKRSVIRNLIQQLRKRSTEGEGAA
ncbi:hypothetical protein AAHC03_013919 [Spirometra sp. Aus1]